MKNAGTIPQAFTIGLVLVLSTGLLPGSPLQQAAAADLKPKKLLIFYAQPIDIRDPEIDISERTQAAAVAFRRYDYVVLNHNFERPEEAAQREVTAGIITCLKNPTCSMLPPGHRLLELAPETTVFGYVNLTPPPPSVAPPEETENQIVGLIRTQIDAWERMGVDGIFQIPPDLVVKFQPIDIVDITLEKILCMRLVSQREIKG